MHHHFPMRHPERSEGSKGVSETAWILRAAQNDRMRKLGAVMMSFPEAMDCTTYGPRYRQGVPFSPRFLPALLVLSLLVPPLAAAPEKWAADIDKFTVADAAQPPAPGGVVFIGSSSIRFWNSLAIDFPGVAALNRGFGGSELADSVFYADRIVISYKPRAVVVYAGENDLNAGKSPETVLADFQAFRAKVHAALPATRILFLAIKESPSREKMRNQVLIANKLIAADCATDPRCTFVDVATPMLDANGKTRPELFRPDRLHLLPAGYAIWTKALAPHLLSDR
jgi:lysophospholipase L1-like esterase